MITTSARNAISSFCDQENRSPLCKQQFLYFSPLPQGQGAFLPIFVFISRALPTQQFLGQDGYVELTDGYYEAGSVMLPDAIPGDYWYARFDMYMGDGTSSTGGADGMVFVTYEANDTPDTSN